MNYSKLDELCSEIYAVRKLFGNIAKFSLKTTELKMLNYVVHSMKLICSVASDFSCYTMYKHLLFTNSFH